MTSAISVPVGVSADGAVAAADAKPIIPIEQAVRELEQVFLPTQSVSTQQPMVLHQAPSNTPGRSKMSRVHNNGRIYTRTTHTHTNNSSSSSINNNNISNNHLPPVVHNVVHHTNGHLNQEPNQSIPPYNNSNVYRGGGVLYHNQPMPGGGGYPHWEQHTFVGGNINQPLHRNPPNNMQWHENGPMPGGGGYPNGEYHHFSTGPRCTH